jgi:UTP--glucose-1-phosphate uridylyltransferase
MQKINKAIFPVAGLGTRFLPATKAMPKEMLPVVDKPLIQYAVEEAYAAGIRQMIFVTGRSKRAIRRPLRHRLRAGKRAGSAGKQELLDLVRTIKPSDMECIYVRQPKALGLGHAVLCAQRGGNEPFAVLLADDLMVGKPPVCQADGGSVQRVAAPSWRCRKCRRAHQALRHRGRHPVNDRLMDLSHIVEKPAPEDARPTWAWPAATS